MDLASIFLLNLAFPLFFELSLCQTDCNGCCDPNTYKVINEPRRSINSIWKQGQTAICDRTLPWGWYRFTSYVGGQMPTSRINPYHCGTVAPIWLRGQHPSSADLTVTVQACTNFFNLSNGCHQPFNVKIRQCSGSPPFYVYYLKPTYSCAIAYCAGTIKPCDYGQVYSMEQCVAAPAEFNRYFLGEPNITHYQPDQDSAEVALKCQVPVNDFIRSWTNVTYQITWYSEGKHLKTDNSICPRLPAPPPGSTIIPDYDSPCLNNGRPLFSRLEGMEYKLNRLISCNVTARHFRSPLSPWCIPKTVRKPFFAGIKVSPSVLTIEECSDKEYTFSLTPTIPVGTMVHTDHLEIGFFLPRKILLQNDNCNVQIRGTQTVTVRVIAQCTNDIKDATKIDKVIIPEIRNTHSGFWNQDVHLPAVWLSIKAAHEIHYCETYMDPHYLPLPARLSSGSWGYSRSSFTFMGHGDFALYKNTERNFEVHTRQWACVVSDTLATCNCGVVLRDHNDVIEFNCCNERLYFDQVTPIRVKVRSKQRLSPGISITQTQMSFYAQYKVLFPSGVKVTVYRNSYGLNIGLHTPRAKERTAESGLCLYDNQIEPDVNKYGSKFRLNHTESFFDVLPSPINDAGVRYDIPCSCDKQDKNGNPECKKELPTHYFNILDQQGRVVVPSGPGLGRKKRNVEYSDDLTDEDFDLFQRLNFGSGVHNRLRRAAPAISRFSKKNATHYCTKLIADTNIGKSCAKVGSNVQALVNSCSVDLELSGDTSFALSAVTLLMNECGEIIGRNMSSYVNEGSEEKPEIPPEISEIVENLCPSDCTFNGRCVNRTCICNHGFTANDCSISIYQIPDISMLQGDGLCDRRERPCKKVSVMGSGFLNSTNMTCHVKEFTVTNSSWTPKKTEIRTTGIMTDLVLAECHLPESPVRPGHYNEVTSGTPAAGLVISMSNDGEHKSSRNLTFISYDSACMTCNVTTGCVLKKNSCFINNYCFTTNEANPIDWCQQCIPNMSERAWTKRQVNNPPQFLSTNQYYALSQEHLELGITVSDPEGMPVTLTLTDGSPRKAVMRDNILLWNATGDSNTRFSLKATDACGAVSTLNITVNLVACQCQNGSCVPHRNKPRGSGFYECNCIPGFTGAKCETNIDDCQSYPCFQGYCYDEVNNFKCICNRGYVGKKCDIDYDDCGVSPCAHGNCTDYPGTYRCACDSGYGGQNCSVDIDECQSSPCRHGTCVDQINGYKCQCQAGYTGIDCDVDIDECQSFPCINGTCANKVNGFNCVCDAGFNGTRCENDINECLLNSCGNGICVDKVNSYSCTCNAGFTGPQCDVAITQCSNDSCYPGVPCTEQISHIVCGPCPSGFTGDGKICEDIDDCVNHTCLNGGSCVDDVNNYTCRCVAGFKGDRCEKMVIRSLAEETTIMAESKLSMANTPATTFSRIVITTSLKDVLLSRSSSAFTSVYTQQQEESILLTTTSSAALSSSVFKATTSFQMPPSIKKTESVQSSPSSSSGTSAVPLLQLPSKSEMTTAKISFSVRSSSIIPGFTSTQKPETEHVFKMKILQEWNEELKDTESIAFKALSARIETEIMKALSSRKDLIGAKVISFSKGSVVAELQLMFRSKVSSDEAFADLKNQISDGNLGNLQVDPASLEQIYPTTQVPTTEDGRKLSFAIIIGISFGGVFIVALITILLVRHCQKKKLLEKRHHSNVMPPDEAFPDRHKYEVEKGKSEENILYLEEKGVWAKPIEGKENKAYDKL